MTATTATVQSHRWFAHPPGLWVLALTETWERFSFFGMKGILVVYMVDHLRRPENEASAIFGWYSGLVFFTPLIGGLLSDWKLGRRTSVITGGLIMAAGHFCMIFESLLLPALGLIVLGCGLFLPTLASQIGSLYAQDDPRRGSAFNIYYLGINLGAFVAPLVIGTLGTTVGWHWGFGTAGVGVIIGLVT